MPDEETDWKAVAEKQLRHLENEQVYSGRLAVEYDELVRHLRAVVENCKTQPVDAIRHQLVGLLPETRGLDPAVAQQMREKGLGHLVDRSEAMVRDSWAEYGYGEGAT